MVFVGVYLCLGDPNEQNIYDQRQKIKSIVVSMLKNLNERYCSHNSNIKYVDSIIKYIDFESFHYGFRLNVVLSFMVFNGFDFMFLSMYC